MCGRYSQTADTQTLLDRFNLGLSEVVVEPRYNLAPGQMGPVAVSIEEPGEEPGPELRMMRWGLVPAWAKEEKVGYRMINARAETVDQKPAFKRLFKTRRCLVLADGFYEWRKAEKGTPKVPFRFTLKDGRPFAMAGLWDRWSGGDGPLTTYTIITTRANRLVARVHERMPVILDPKGEADWLEAGTGRERLQALLEPYDPRAMSGHPVSARLNKPAHDDPGLILPEEAGEERPEDL